MTPFIQHVQNVANAPGRWPDEFLAWYKPDKWETENRAAAVFLGEKFAAMQSELERLRAQVAPACVWGVSNDTSSVLFATREAADAFCATQSIAAGLTIAAIPVLGAAPAQQADQIITAPAGASQPAETGGSQSRAVAPDQHSCHEACERPGCVEARSQSLLTVGYRPPAGYRLVPEEFMDWVGALPEGKAQRRLDWLHSPESNNVDGWMWGIFRVKWNASGGVASLLHTNADFSDIDAAILASSPHRPSSEWYRSKIAETDCLDDFLPCGALTAQPAAQAEPVAMRANIADAFLKCKDEAIKSGAHESYQAVREAFDGLQAALVANAAPSASEALVALDDMLDYSGAFAMSKKRQAEVVRQYADTFDGVADDFEIST